MSRSLSLSFVAAALLALACGCADEAAAGAIDAIADELDAVRPPGSAELTERDVDRTCPWPWLGSGSGPRVHFTFEPHGTSWAEFRDAYVGALVRAGWSVDTSGGSVKLTKDLDGFDSFIHVIQDPYPPLNFTVWGAPSRPVC